MADLVNVNVKIGKNTQTIQIEKGVTFENKGGIYAVDENGKLQKFDKTANVWTSASQIEMTNYQWKVFQNVANNDGDVKTYSKADIEKAQAMYRKGGFTTDMSQDLPSGYKIEKPKLDSKQDYVQVDVTNGKPAQSATLKFQIQEISELKAASEAHQNQNVAENNKANVAVSLNDKTAEIVPLKDSSAPTGESFVYAYKASKNGVTSYYDENKKLVGTMQELPNGKTKYMDKDGNCLYYEKYKQVRPDGQNGNEEEHRYIYDSNNRLKFIIKYDYNNPETASAGRYMKYEEYGKDGKVIKTGTASHNIAYTTELDSFEPLEKPNLMGEVFYSIGSLSFN